MFFLNFVRCCLTGLLGLMLLTEFGAAQACACRTIIPEDFLFEENDYGYVGEIVEVTALLATKNKCRSKLTLAPVTVFRGNVPKEPEVIVRHDLCFLGGKLFNQSESSLNFCGILTPPPVGEHLRVFGNHGSSPRWERQCSQAVKWQSKSVQQPQ